MILAENGDTKSVAGMCQNLSRIMRYVTDFKTRIVTIREELDYIKEYLYCMKMRNQSSLQYEILVDDSLLDITLPKLCIHPLVENALKYGTNCSPPWTVKIYSIIQENFWKICVEDTGPGFSEETLNHLKAQIETFALDSSEIPKLQINGLGLANIYIRMSIYFMQSSRADILSPLNDLTRVLLIFVVIMILIASIVSHYLAKRLAHPIAHLKHIIQRMQLSNLGSESPASYPVFSVELKELYDSFSEMNQKLKTSRDQLLKVQNRTRKPALLRSSLR